MGGIAAHLRESGRSFAAVFRSANLRRLQGAWTAVAIGHWGLLVAVSVYAYDQGGEKAVGIIFLLRLVPAGLLAPFVGVSEYRRELVLFVSALLRFGFCAAAAVCVWKDAPAVLVYAFAIVTSIANAPYKSAQAAIMPTLAATPSELTATNAVSSTVESLAFFLGPAVARLPARRDRDWRRRTCSRRGDVRDRIARHSPDERPENRGVEGGRGVDDLQRMHGGLPRRSSSPERLRPTGEATRTRCAADDDRGSRRKPGDQIEPRLRGAIRARSPYAPRTRRESLARYGRRARAPARRGASPATHDTKSRSCGTCRRRACIRTGNGCGVRVRCAVRGQQRHRVRASAAECTVRAAD